MRPTLPNVQIGPLDPSGRWLGQWVQFFTTFATSPGAISPVELGESPATLVAPDDGHYLVTGGTGVAITLQRGRLSRATGLASGMVPVSRGDSLALSYTTTPSVSFIPS